jgi:hypothetical protein
VRWFAPPVAGIESVCPGLRDAERRPFAARIAATFSGIVSPDTLHRCAIAHNVSPGRTTTVMEAAASAPGAVRQPACAIAAINNASESAAPITSSTAVHRRLRLVLVLIVRSSIVVRMARHIVRTLSDIYRTGVRAKHTEHVFVLQAVIERMFASGRRTR